MKKQKSEYTIEVIEQVFTTGIKYIYIVRRDNLVVMSTTRFVKGAP